ncbi:MAG: hypothetical protein R3F53_26705 [Gammaproteobacteria bacterium]
MSLTESSFATLSFTTLIVTLAGLCTLPMGWQPLREIDISLLALASIVVASAHFLLIETFRLAEASWSHRLNICRLSGVPYMGF